MVKVYEDIQFRFWSVVFSWKFLSEGIYLIGIVESAVYHCKDTDTMRARQSDCHRIGLYLCSTWVLMMMAS